jgi:gliding motility-associated-like protein
MLGDTSICDDELQYVGMTATSGGEWSYFGTGNLTFSNSTTLNPFIEVDSYGTYILNFYDNYCQDTLSHELVFVADPYVEIPPFDTICVGNNLTIAIISNTLENSTYTWYDASGNSVATGDTVVLVTEALFDGVYDYSVAAQNFCGIATDNLQIVAESCEIPNVISPNGDNINDYFYTQFAVNYDDVNLTIFNRWGRVVYKTETYKNDWNGVNMNDKPLADGTYYFVLTYNNGTKDHKGTVNIFNNK